MCRLFDCRGADDSFPRTWMPPRSGRRRIGRNGPLWQVLTRVKAPWMEWAYNVVKANGEKLKMSHTPHELAEEFPEHAAKMSELKQSDAHFANLFDSYHELNRIIHRAETNVEPMDDLAETELRKQRSRLKDQIWGYLSP